ncbi:hypothetical protein ACFVR1_06750 [Psychrobacillus sp. NPDC058041]|uniref:hypothetical protein n=1 Tax=Psychrobacillus sp. NPDC058041 TaxID=3346310 RepID=UPI0036DAB2B3
MKRREVDEVDKIEFYIPSLLDFLDHSKDKWLEEVRIVGVKTNNVKYFIGHNTKKMTRIEKIVAEDFTIYDLKLDFHNQTLSFYLDSVVMPSHSIILQKVFQTFAVRYNARKIGFFLYAPGRNRPQPVKVFS